MILLVFLTACGRRSEHKSLKTWYSPLDPLVQGELQCRINSAQNRISEIDKNKFLKDTAVTLNGEDYPLDKCIDDGGNLISGVRFIVLSVTIRNDSAENKDPDVSSPFIFRMDSLIYLDDLGTDEQGAYGYSGVSYFSEMNEEKDHPLAFRLKQGEERTVEVGFLIGDRPDGTSVNLEELCASPASGNPDAVLIDLGLKQGEGL